MKNIHCWSAPRTCSTGLWWAMACRGDASTSNETFLLEQNPDGKPLSQFRKEYSKYENWIRNIKAKAAKDGTNITFVKEHGWVFAHLIEENLFDKMTLSNAQHIILFREPKSAMDSFVKVMKKEKFELRSEECSWEGLEAIYHHLKSKKEKVILLSADELCKHPKRTLKKLCQDLEIPFKKQMLCWKPPTQLEDCDFGHWFSTLAKSDKFMRLRVTDPGWKPPVLLRKTLDHNLVLYSSWTKSKQPHDAIFEPKSLT